MALWQAGILVGSVYFTCSQGVWGNQQDVTECLKRWQEYARSINTRRPPTFDHCGKVVVSTRLHAILIQWQFGINFEIRMYSCAILLRDVIIKINSRNVTWPKIILIWIAMYEVLYKCADHTVIFRRTSCDAMTKIHTCLVLFSLLNDGLWDQVNVLQNTKITPILFYP